MVEEHASDDEDLDPEICVVDSDEQHDYHGVEQMLHSQPIMPDPGLSGRTSPCLPHAGLCPVQNMTLENTPITDMNLNSRKNGMFTTKIYFT